MNRRSVIATVGTNFALPLASLLTGPLLARALGPSDRGYLAAIVVPLFLLGIMGTFGLQDAFTQFIARKNLPPSDAARIGVRALVVCTAISAGLLMLIYVATLGGSAYLALASAMLGALVFNIGGNLAAGIANGMGAYDLVNAIKIVTTVGRTLLIAVAFFAHVLTIEVAAAVQAYSGTLALLIVLIPLSRRVRATAPTSEETPTGVVRFGLTLWIGVLANLSSARLDQVIGLPLLGSTQLGLYAAAVAIAEVTTAVAAAARVFILGPGDRDGDSMSRVVLLCCLLVSASLAASSPLLVQVLLGSEYRGAVVPLALCCAAAFLWNVVTVVSSICVRIGSARGQSIVLLATAITNLLLLAYFAHWGASGAALASIGAYALGTVGLLVVVARRREVSTARAARMLLPGIGTALELVHLLQRRVRV